MSRSIAFAVVVAATSIAAAAAPQRQLVAPELNPALRTVPSVPHTYDAGNDNAACDARLVTHIDSGTVIPGPDGRVAHVTGMTDGAMGDGELVVTSISADGLSATADFLACASPIVVTTTPVSASLQLHDARFQTIAVRTETNTIIVTAR